VTECYAEFSVWKVLQLPKSEGQDGKGKVHTRLTAGHSQTSCCQGDTVQDMPGPQAGIEGKLFLTWPGYTGLICKGEGVRSGQNEQIWRMEAHVSADVSGGERP